MRYELTGNMGGKFLSKSSHGNVLNFYVYRGGYYNNVDEKYIRYSYPFEVWMKELIVKTEEIPKNSLVTVGFTMIPKEKIINETKIIQIQLKVDTIINWSNRKGAKGDVPFIQMEFALLEENHEGPLPIFPEDTDE